ncbi:MAG: type II CAAX endopeptidase family protein [Pseudomonadota bacterium]
MPLLRNQMGQVRLLWRLAGFAVLFGLLVSPLLLLDSALLQFAIGAILLTILLSLWGRRIEHRKLADYGLSADTSMAGELCIGAALAGGAVAIIFLLTHGLGFAGSAEYDPAALLTAGFWLFLVKALLVGYWEEVLFRGYLFVNIRDSAATSFGPRQGKMIAVLITSLLFGLAHAGTSSFSWSALAILSFNGVVFCVPMLVTGRLGLSIGMHAAWNFSQSKVFGFAMSGNPSAGSVLRAEMTGPDLWTGGNYGPEAGLAGIMGLLVLLIAVYGVAVRRLA